jgi:hypothetical protein
MPRTQFDIPRRVRVAALAVAVVLIVSVVARSAAAWKYWGDLDHNSPGTWLCMAADARDGILYRPIVSQIGYGGTRYAPLFPVIIAGFMRAGVGPVHSGFLAGLISAVVAVSGLFVLLRRMETPIAFAATMAAFVLAATCARTIILGIKGDLLPVGLALWGLAAVIRSEGRLNSVPGLIGAAICFALALAAKITSVFGIGAAVLWLLFHRKFRNAAILSVAWLAAVTIIVLLTQWASDGRAGSIFLLCARGGGNVHRLLQGPHLLLADLAAQDRTLLAVWLLAIIIIVATRQWTSLPAIFLLVTTAGTIVIYGSPGTHLNHLVDMDGAVMLVIATLSTRSRVFHSPVLVVTLLLVMLAAGACWRQIGEMRRHNERRQMESALTDTESSTSHGPILAEDPLLPLLAGQRPYMLDPFMFRAIRKQKPEIADRFWEDLDGRHFKAVILRGPPDDPQYSSNEGDFGPGFIQRLCQEYALASVHGSFYVFLPKP